MDFKDKLIAKDPGMSVTTMGAVVTLVITLLGGGWWVAGLLDTKADAADVQIQQQRIDHIYDTRIEAQVRQIAAIEAKMTAGTVTPIEIDRLKQLRLQLDELQTLSHK